MDEILELRIKEIRQEAEQVITLILEEIHSRPVLYLAGQFLTILVNIGKKELRRSYSLCSTPDVDTYLAITIKRVQNGEVSRYLIDHLRTGQVIKALPPAGRFVLETDPKKQRDIFLIGAGSGMTPLFSLLKSMIYKEPFSKITLIASHKNEESALYFKEINTLKSKFPGRLEIVKLYSDPEIKNKKYQRRLNIGLLEELVHSSLKFKKEDAQFFACGPFVYMRMVRMTLIYMGFEESQIHKENFLTKAFDVERELPMFPAQTVRLTYKNEAYSIEVPPGKTILKAALDNGISLPYSCQAGICSTCTAICTSGKIRMSNNEVLTDKEVKDGAILTCVSYPETEGVVIEVG